MFIKLTSLWDELLNVNVNRIDFYKSKPGKLGEETVVYISGNEFSCKETFEEIEKKIEEQKRTNKASSQLSEL